MKSLFLGFILTITLGAYASTFSRSSATVTTTSAMVVDKDPFREYLLIQNNGASNVLVKMDSAHSASEGIVIVPGGNYEPFVAPTNAIYLKAASGSNAVEILTSKK